MMCVKHQIDSGLTMSTLGMLVLCFLPVLEQFPSKTLYLFLEQKLSKKSQFGPEKTSSNPSRLHLFQYQDRFAKSEQKWEWSHPEAQSMGCSDFGEVVSQLAFFYDA